MILGPKLLLQLVKRKNLFENLSERELTNPEGAGFDLRLGEVFKFQVTLFLVRLTDEIPGIESVMVYDPKSLRVSR